MTSPNKTPIRQVGMTSYRCETLDQTNVRIRSLTPREREVLAWVAQGKSAAQIAEILHIANRTVNEHVQTCTKKLGALNRTHAVAIALRDRIIEV